MEAAPAAAAVHVDEDWQWLVEQQQSMRRQQSIGRLEGWKQQATVETSAVKAAAAAKAKETAREKLQRCKKKKKTVNF